ncbi:MAG: M20/M25/M40 family metallo-hydrolase [Fimbriimonadales bacterium]
MINRDRLFSLFEQLCLINAPALQEKESVAWTKKHLQAIGLEVWEDNAGQAIGGNANNLIAKLHGNKPGADSIFLSAHFDTVEPTAGLEIGVRGDDYYSVSDTILGADDKAGMAPAIEAVQCIMESDEPHGDVYLLLSCAEEIGLKGAFALDIQSINVDYGYVFDTGPPVGSFVTRVGTYDKLTAKIFGKPAHAGKDPEHGISAIHAAATAIAAMTLGRIDEETTANVGLISGGSALNVVPAQVVVNAESRSFSVEKLKKQIDHMSDCFRMGAEKFGAKLELDLVRNYSGYEVSSDAKVVTNALAAAKRIGFDFPLRATLGGSDANAYNLKGVPTIVCGTGMKEIHTHDEYVSKTDLVDMTRLAIELIRTAAQ